MTSLLLLSLAMLLFSGDDHLDVSCVGHQTVILRANAEYHPYTLKEYCATISKLQFC